MNRLTRFFKKIYQRLGGFPEPVYLRSYSEEGGINWAQKPGSLTPTDLEIVPRPFILPARDKRDQLMLYPNKSGMGEIYGGEVKLVMENTPVVTNASLFHFADSDWKVVKINRPYLFREHPIMIITLKRVNR